MKRNHSRLVLAVILTLMLMLVVGGFVLSSAASTVAGFTITGLAVPESGARPDTMVTVPADQMRVHSVDWYDETSKRFLEGNDTFLSEHVYTAIIWVEANSGYSFVCENDNTPSVDAFVYGEQATVNKAYEYKAWAMVEVCYTFGAIPKQGWVKSIDVAIPVPEGGKPLSYARCSRTGYETANIFTESNEAYHTDRKNGIGWWNQTSGQSLKHADNPIAAPGMIYSVSVDVVPDVGYAFSPDVTFKVNGIPAEGNLDYGGAVAGIRYEFPVTKTKIYRIDLDVKAPKTEELPQYPALSGTGYTYANVQSDVTVNGITYSAAGIKLNKNEPFAANTVYTVTAELKLLPNYELHPQVNLYINGVPATTGGADGNGVFRVSANFTTGEGTPVHNHIPSGWISDGTDHYRVCIDSLCRQEIPGTRSPHTGGTATCQLKKKCTVCGVLYGEYGNHSWSEDWDYSDKTGHARVCTTPGCTAKDTVIAHQEGPAGTPDAATVCAQCGYIIRPAANHVHSLNKIPAKDATCVDPGTREHYACSGCSDLFKDSEGKEVFASPEEIVVAPQGHLAGDWTSDGEYHWRSCETCKEPLEETKMLHADSDGNGTCDTCGGKEGEVFSPSTNTSGSDVTPGGNATDGTPGTASEGSSGEGGGLLLPLMVGGGALVLAVGAALLIFRKKLFRSSGKA